MECPPLRWIFCSAERRAQCRIVKDVGCRPSLLEVAAVYGLFVVLWLVAVGASEGWLVETACAR
jgi:hypothetical protein